MRSLGAGQARPPIRAGDPERAAQARLHLTAAGDSRNVLCLEYTLAFPETDTLTVGVAPSPRRETMNFDFASDLIDQAARLAAFGRFAFIGGEALLFYQDVLRLGERMHARSMPFSLSSSCFFASTTLNAERVMRELAERGMTILNLQRWGHLRWIPTAHVRRAIDAAVKLGIHVRISAGPWDDPCDLGREFPEYVGSSSEVILLDSIDDGPAEVCFKRFHCDVTVLWQGDVYPGCPLRSRPTPRGSFANLYERDLGRVWSDLNNCSALRLLRSHALPQLSTLVSHARPDALATFPRARPSARPCDLCERLYRDPSLATAPPRSPGRKRDGSSRSSTD